MRLTSCKERLNAERQRTNNKMIKQMEEQKGSTERTNSNTKNTKKLTITWSLE